MTQEWYGEVPTGAQAAVAMRLLAELSSSDHPDAIEVLSTNIYVDDVNPGVETEAKRDTTDLLNSISVAKGRVWLQIRSL